MVAHTRVAHSNRVASGGAARFSRRGISMSLSLAVVHLSRHLLSAHLPEIGVSGALCHRSSLASVALPSLGHPSLGNGPAAAFDGSIGTLVKSTHTSARC